MTWLQTTNGGVFDLLDPRPEQVDFREIAWGMAHINRYCGRALRPVSVALHTMIACACGDDGDRCYLLLHDAHEVCIGDLPTPFKQALSVEDENARNAVERITARIDAAIYRAAGLAPPSPEMRARIRRADLRALNTERRDFLAPAPKSWGAEIDAVGALGDMRALRPLYRDASKGAAHMADLLARQFEQCLPSLKRAA